MEILYIIFFTITLLWVIWAIGYPIYCKIKHKKVFDNFNYCLGLNSGAILLNIINLIVKLIK